MGTVEEANIYLENGFYLSLTGYLCKVREQFARKIHFYNEILKRKRVLSQDKSENSVRKLLESNGIPLDRLIVESDAPFMYPNTRASKLSQTIKSGLTDRSLMFLHR